MKGTEFMRVLTVVDMQNDFITGTLGNKECQAVVGNVVNVINTGNYDKIIATRDTHFEGYLNTQEGYNQYRGMGDTKRCGSSP